MRVRPFAKADLLDVVALRARCFARSMHASPDALAAYFAEVFSGIPGLTKPYPRSCARKREAASSAFSAWCHGG